MATQILDFMKEGGIEKSRAVRTHPTHFCFWQSFFHDCAWDFSK